MMRPRLPTTPAMWIALVAGILAVILLSSWAWNSFKRGQAVKTQERVEDGQAGAAQGSARDAIATHGNVAANAAATEETGDRHEETIRNAPGADQVLDPGVNRAARRGMCDYRANADKAECRVQRTPS
jgi:hypothetical protein